MCDFVYVVVKAIYVLWLVSASVKANAFFKFV